MKLLIATVVGFLLVAGSPSQDQAPKPPDEEHEYAKVELKGRLDAEVRSRPGAGSPTLCVHGDRYGLDLSQQKELQGEALRKLDGETVIVTGTLSLRAGSMQMTRVRVSSLRLVKER